MGLVGLRISGPFYGRKQIPQVGVYLGKLIGVLLNVRHRGFQIGRIVPGQLPVKINGLVQLLDHTTVIQDQAVLLAGMQAVDPRNGLQQGVFLELAGQIKDRIAGSIKAGEQFIHHDDDLGMVAALKAIDQLLVVVFLGSEALHHGLPELLFICRRSVLLPFTLPGRGC